LTLEEYELSADCFERAAQILTKIKGYDAPETLRVRSNVGVPLKKKGDLDGALRVYEDVLETQKKVLEPRHHDVASTLINIGSALREKGLYHEVLPRYQETLAIREEALAKTDPEDPERKQLLSDLAESLNNIGAGLMDLGRHREASPYLERALSTHEGDLNDVSHGRYAGTAMTLGSALRAQKRYRDARARLEHALKIHRRVLPEEHSVIAKNLMSLGALLEEQANRDGSLLATEQEEVLRSAHKYLEEALTLSEALHGRDHGITGGILRVLADVTNTAGHLEDERLYRERAEAIRRQHFASVDVDTASELDRGAMALAERGLYEEATAYQRYSLQLRSEAFGEKSLEAAVSLFALSRLLLLQGLDEQARPYLKQVLVAREELPEQMILPRKSYVKS
jgi:tetratricopeptide (TPR) repeat protein